MARRRFEPKLFLASLGIAAGLVLIVWGVSVSVTGDEAQNLPDAIESINPVRDAAQVPSQTEVFVDLREGYEASLAIDDIPLDTIRLDEVAVPDGQQAPTPLAAVFEPGNVTIRFTPTAGAPVEEFTPGTHTATVIYWKAVDGPAHARSFTWTFQTV